MDLLGRILCASRDFTLVPNGALAAFQNVFGGVACRAYIPRGFTEPPRMGRGRSGVKFSPVDEAYCLVAVLFCATFACSGLRSSLLLLELSKRRGLDPPDQRETNKFTPSPNRCKFIRLPSLRTFGSRNMTTFGFDCFYPPVFAARGVAPDASPARAGPLLVPPPLRRPILWVRQSVTVPR